MLHWQHMSERAKPNACEAEPKLVQEVLLPRPRSGGAAAVLVATMAMFTAIGASAFVVRARSARRHSCQTSRRPPSVAPIPPRLDSHDNSLTEAFWDARNRGDHERGLDIYLHLSVERRLLLASARDEMAHTFQAEQLARIDEAVLDLRCEDAQHALDRLRTLVPEAQLPVAMDACVGR
jgi:hypothetical protein